MTPKTASGRKPINLKAFLELEETKKEEIDKLIESKIAGMRQTVDNLTNMRFHQELGYNIQEKNIGDDGSFVVRMVQAKKKVK